MRCIICGEDKTASKEHIIPEALGNTKFVTYKVCEECNNKLGTNVDSYITNYFLVKLIRKDKGYYGKGKQDIKLFPGALADENGKKHSFQEDKPSIISNYTVNDSKYTFEAKNKEETVLLAKKVLAKQGVSDEEIEKLISGMEFRETSKQSPTFSMNIDLELDRFLLSGAKVAYEYANEILGEEYYKDEVAQILREMLYKAAYSNKNKINECIEYDLLCKYVKLSDKECNDLLESIQNILSSSTLDIRHICVISDSYDGKLVCYLYLMLEAITTFIVLLSHDSSLYNFVKKSKKIIIFGNHDVLYAE